MIKFNNNSKDYIFLILFILIFISSDVYIYFNFKNTTQELNYNINKKLNDVSKSLNDNDSVLTSVLNNKIEILNKIKQRQSYADSLYYRLIKNKSNVKIELIFPEKDVLLVYGKNMEHDWIWKDFQIFNMVMDERYEQKLTALGFREIIIVDIDNAYNFSFTLK